MENLWHTKSPKTYFLENYSNFRDECTDRLFNHTENFGQPERILLEAINVQTVMDWLIRQANPSEKAKLSDLFDEMDIYNISKNYLNL